MRASEHEQGLHKQTVGQAQTRAGEHEWGLPKRMAGQALSYFEIVFAVVEHFWWRKHCQKRGGK
jgi:hypothetical protein